MLTPYFQSSEFTCGPACLMMAMRKIDPKRRFDPLEEFLIWREANSIFMGHRHAGCTQYGLARAALRRGFEVQVYSSGIANFDRHFEDCVLSPKEKTIFKMVHAHDRKKAEQEGLNIKKEKLSKKLLAGLLKDKKALIMLIRSFDDDEEHWVKITKIEGDKVSLSDPYEHNLTDVAALETAKGGTHRVSYERLERRCTFGKNKDYLLLALSAAAKE